MLCHHVAIPRLMLLQPSLRQSLTDSRPLGGGGGRMDSGGIENGLLLHRHKITHFTAMTFLAELNPKAKAILIRDLTK